MVLTRFPYVLFFTPPFPAPSINLPTLIIKLFPYCPLLDHLSIQPLKCRKQFRHDSIVCWLLTYWVDEAYRGMVIGGRGVRLLKGEVLEFAKCRKREKCVKTRRKLKGHHENAILFLLTFHTKIFYCLPSLILTSYPIC